MVPQFQRKVHTIQPVHQVNALYGLKWEVTTHSVLESQDQGETDVYDVVIVCNG